MVQKINENKTEIGDFGGLEPSILVCPIISGFKADAIWCLQKSLSSVLPKPQGDLPTVKAGVVNAHLDKNIIGVPMDPHKLTFFIPCHPHSDPSAL